MKFELTLKEVDRRCEEMEAKVAAADIKAAETARLRSAQEKENAEVDGESENDDDEDDEDVEEASTGGVASQKLKRKN